MAEHPQFKLGRVRGPERPERWLYRLVPPAAADRTRVRSLARFFMQPPFDQGNEGSCTANSGCLIAMACAKIDNVQLPEFSRMWMYYWEREVLHTFPKDSGADVIDEFDVDDQHGNIAEQVWPYTGNPAEKPPAAAHGAPTYKTVAAYQPIASTQFIDGILTALDNNQPVAIGVNWYNGWFDDFKNTGVLTAAAVSQDQLAGGHALSIKGWIPPGAPGLPQGGYVCQNSWGPTSPARTDLWQDAQKGDVIIPAEVLDNPAVNADANAAVPMTAPATLSLAIIPPTEAATGAPTAFAAVVTGAPDGTQIDYQWAFGDGGTGRGRTASHTYAASGDFTVTCTAHVATTGAQAVASTTVQVSTLTPAAATA